MSNIIYQGRRVPSVIVLVLDEATKKSKTLNPCHSQDVNHSPAKFDWGYQGSGPSQLALALLLDAIGETPIEQRPSPETATVLAERWYQQFKNDHVSNWGDDTFRITQAEIMGWLRTVFSQAKIRREQYSMEPQFPKDPNAPVK
ncbi:MAG: DUF6166 domain-containing protein [Azonexus sp.]